MLLPDGFLTGEHKQTNPERKTDINHFHTYNQSDTALRVQDIITGAAYLKSIVRHDDIDLIGAGEAGLWTIFAAPFVRSEGKVVVDAAGFDTGSDQVLIDQMFIPGLRRAGDFRTAQAVLAPQPLMIHNTQDHFRTEWAVQAYRSARAEEDLVILSESANADEITDWLRK